MTQREIQGHLEEIYGVEVSPSLISTVTDTVLDEVRAWQSRPLEDFNFFKELKLTHMVRYSEFGRGILKNEFAKAKYIIKMTATFYFA
jgi:hypothetical protein